MESPQNSAFRVVFRHRSPDPFSEQKGVVENDDPGGAVIGGAERTSLIKREC